MKKRIKQYSFWTGLSAAVVILIGSIAKAFGFHFKEEVVSDIIMSVCGILVVFGVVNAPYGDTESSDDTSKEETKTEKETSKTKQKETQSESKLEDENDLQNVESDESKSENTNQTKN